MATIAQINQTLEDSVSLKYIAQAYSEIAALRLQKIRAGIERNRTFFQEITQVLRMVKVAASKHNILPVQKKGNVSILITSNHRFYGDLESKLIRFFLENTSQFPTERIVIGKSGSSTLDNLGLASSYQTFDFGDDLPTLDELRRMVINLMSYQQILVYYSRMQSVLVQEPHVVDILQKPPEHYLTTTGKSFGAIFEPELPKMMAFFDSQVTTILLEQTFFESELARTASRLISMDQAQTKAGEFIKQGQRQILQVKRSTDSARLLDTMAVLNARQRGNYGRQF